MTAEPEPKKGPPWVLIGIGVAVLGLSCCCLTGGLLVLGAAGQPPGPGAGPGAPAVPSAPDAARKYILIPVEVSWTPGYPAAEVPGRWGEVQGGFSDRFLRADVGHVVFERTENGSATYWAFGSDGSYEVRSFYASSQTLSHAQAREVGRYSCDGSTLTLEPTAAHATFQIAQSRPEVHDDVPSSRTYAVFRAVVKPFMDDRPDGPRNDALVFSGPPPPWAVGPQPVVRYVLQRTE